MPKFKHHQKLVDAFQWNGSESMREHIDSEWSTREGSELLGLEIDQIDRKLMVDTASGNFEIKIGWWLVYGNDGTINWYSESDFKVFFEPVDEKELLLAEKVLDFFEEQGHQQHSDEVHCVCLAAAIDEARKHFNLY